MTEHPPARIPASPGPDGPVPPGSLLYRLLQKIARRVAEVLAKQSSGNGQVLPPP
jgi:hypothetical protein